MQTERLSYKTVDCYIFSKEHNRKYFSEFSSSWGYFFATKNLKVYVTDARYQKAIKDHFANSDVKIEITKDLSFAVEKYKKFLPKNPKIGFEGEISVDEFAELKSSFANISGSEFISVSQEISSLRGVKTKEEIEKIAFAMEISAKAYQEFLKTVRVGQTERELMAQLNYQLYHFGADSLAFDTIVASGENGAKPHATPSERKIRNGDFVTCDFGAKRDGYNADITRTFAVGEVSKKQREVYEIVRSAQEKSLAMAVAGQSAKSLHEKAMEVISKEGYGEYFTHGLGHGVGVEIHEFPTLNGTSGTILEENMVATIEPGIYIEGEFGVRIEDTIVVLANKNRNLNLLSKELQIICQKHLKN